MLLSAANNGDTDMKKLKTFAHVAFIIVFVLMSCLAMFDSYEMPCDTAFDMDNIMTHIEKLTENGPRSIVHSEANAAALEYVATTLESFGLVNGDTTDAPAYLIQEFVARDVDYQNFYLENIIVHLPANSASPSGDAVMFMGHTDSVPMGDGASDDGVAVSVMLEAVNYYVDKMENGFESDHDLVFCFVNGEEYGLYGSYAFMNEFKAFDNVADRIKFGTNLESRGTEGTLIMFETAANNYNTIKLLSEINENVFTCSIATMVYDTMPNSTDFSNFKDACQGLNFANILGGENYHTQNDSLENVGKTYVSAQANIVDKLVSRLADYELDRLYDAEGSAVFFSYLNAATVVYSPSVAVVLGVILVAIVALNLLLNLKQKQFIRTLKSVGVVILTLAVSAGLIYGCYYLFQYIASLAGIIDVNMIGTVTYSNVYIVTGIGITVLVAIMLISRLSVRVFGVEYRDLTRAFAYIHAFLGAVLSFVLPDASYLFVFSGLALMMIELLVSVFRKTGISELHLEALVTALYMPIILPVVALATSALGMTLAYVYGLVFALGLFDVGVFLASILDVKKTSYAKKLFAPLTCVMIIVAAVLFTCVSLTKPNASVNLQGKQNLAKLPYDDALVYVVDADGSEEYRIYDLNAYSYLEKYANEMTYNGEYYVGKANKHELAYQIKTHVADSSLVISKVIHDSYVYLTFTDIEAESFTVDDGVSNNTYDLKGADTYEIMIHSDCTISINGGTAAVEYTEVVRDYALMIPDKYPSQDKLHFNLWMTDSFVIGK